jgi:hypothetical protein
MSLRSELEEIGGIVGRLLDALSQTVTSQTGRDGVLVRQQISNLRAFYIDWLRDKTFANNLLVCFTDARVSNSKLSSFVVVRNVLFAETPVGDISTAIVQTATAYCLAAEARIIGDIEFKSRDDVDAMIQTMKAAFDTARDLAADSNDSSCYQTLTSLAGALTAYLANTSRPLPRMVTFKMATTLPALTLSQRIYYTANRWEEVVDENKTIHPAFMQRDIIGLAS